MKVWVMAVCATLGSMAVPAFAEQETEDRCRLRIGHERPAGCAVQKPRALPGSTPQAPAKSQAAPRRPPNEAWMEMLRYPKNWASQKQSTRLLMRELTRLERLLAVTPKRSPERAQIIRRLADGYAELEQLAAVERMRAELNHARAQPAGTPP